MGLRYRKSINVGLGFRVNLSKSGIGYSWGVPGARLTKTATGRNRITLSIPGTGFSWVEESGSKKNNNRRDATAPSTPAQPVSGDVVPVRSIENADVSAFAPAEYKDFLDAVNRFIALNTLMMLLVTVSACLTVYFLLINNNMAPFMLLISILALSAKIIIKETKKINLHYDMDSFGEKQAELVKKLASLLQESEMLWQVNEVYAVANTKTNAGANQNIDRFPIQIHVKQPGFLKTSAQCYRIRLKDESIYILPDKLLIIKGFKVGAIDLKELDIKVNSTIFVEESAPSDAEVVGTTWLKVNKDGSRDKRFAHNQQLSMCKYGEITFISKQGFNTEIHVSNIIKARAFSSVLKAAKN